MRDTLNDVFTGKKAISVQLKNEDAAPIIGVVAVATVAAADLAILDVDDTVTFEGTVMTRKAATTAADLEFLNAVGLAACINHTNSELGDYWTGAESSGAVTITRDVAGILGNGKTALINVKESTTANGAEAVKASAVIAEASIARVVAASSDFITFDGHKFPRVAATPTAAKGEWDDAESLAAAMDLMTNWDVTEDGGDVTVTAAENGEVWNGRTVDLTMHRVSAAGVDGTVGTKNQLIARNGTIYLASDDITTANTDISLWKVLDVTDHE